ncbi:hypothetical protein Tco_1154166 [Tanacetum coccineum]
MSNSNTNLQTQSSNDLHNAIMEAGSKDRPPMLAPVLTSTTTGMAKGCDTCYADQELKTVSLSQAFMDMDANTE